MLITYQNRRRGLKYLAASIIIGVVISGTIIHTKSLPPFSDANLFDPKHHLNIMPAMHLFTHNYISSYGMGIALAIAVIHRYKVSDRMSVIGWLSFGLLYQSVFYVPHYWRETGNQTRLNEIIFGALQRTLYSSGVTWFLYRMITVDSLLSRFLASKVFVPFGRMFLTMFLGMTFAIFYDLHTVRQPLDWRMYDIANRTVYTTLYGILVGYLMHIVIEAPFMVMMKTMLAKKVDAKKQE